MLVVHVPWASLVGANWSRLGSPVQEISERLARARQRPSGQFPLQHKTGEERPWETGVTSLEERKRGGTLLLSANR